MNGALPRASRALSRVYGGPGAGGSRTLAAPRRGMASHAEEPVVTWADYRSGRKTINEWVDANRHVVAGGFFCFYVGLAAWNLRPGKKKRKDAKAAASATADDAEATLKSAASDAEGAVKSTAADAKAAATDAKETAKSTAADAKSAATDAKENAKSTAADAKENAKSTAADAKAAVKSTAADAKTAAKSAAQTASDALPTK